MMNYINFEKKRLCGRNNQNIGPFVSDFDTVTSAQFTFIDSTNKIVDPPEAAGYYFAGSFKMNQASEDLLWLCKNYSIDDNVLTFTEIDTYTSGYLKNVKKKWTEVNIEIGIYDGNIKQVLLRDIALANPRVYLDGILPHPIESDFYTKEEVDAILSGLSGTIIDDAVQEVQGISSVIIEEVSGSFISRSEKGASNGVAELDGDGKVLSGQLPLATIGNPAATPGTLGAVYLGGNMGFKMTTVNGTDILTLDPPDSTTIANRSSPYKAIVTTKINDAVKAALTDSNHLTLTEEQQATAQSVLGIDSVGGDFVPLSSVGIPSGVASLDDNGHVPSGQLPLATKTENGTIKVWTTDIGNGAGPYIDSNGMLTLRSAPEVYIDIRNTTTPITPKCLNYAVKAALTDANHITLTEEQQTTAQSVLGIDDVGGDFVPLSSVGAPSGVAELDANGKVPSGQIPFATGETTGGLITRSRYGNALNAQGVLYLVRATYSEINNKNNSQVEATIYKPIVPANLDYAVRSVMPNVTTIPAATTAFTLLDASDTTNSHSITYQHTPSSVPTYTLPAVTDTTVLHDIVLYVKFTYQTLSYNFQDTSENAIIPLSTPYIEHGKVICFLCEYSPLLSKWVIMPIDMGS